METRIFSKKRQLVNFDNLAGMIGEQVIVCVPRAALQVARVLVGERGFWRSTYSKGVINDFSYEIPSFGEFDALEDELSEFMYETEVVTMPLCEDLISKLDTLNATIAGLDLSCVTNVTGGTGGCGPGSSGAGPSEGLQTESVDNGVDPPPGFATYSEYQDYKCNASEQIIQEILSDVGWIKVGNLATITLTAFLGALLTPVPGDEVLLLVGFVLSLFLQGVLVGTATAVESAINANIDDLRCCLYAAYDPDEAKTCFGDLGLTGPSQQLLNFLVWYDGLNRLFEPGVIGDLGVDCSACVVDDLELWLGGTTDMLDFGQDITIAPVNISGIWRVQIGIHQANCTDLTTINVLQNTAQSGAQSSANLYTWNTCTSWNTFYQGETIAVGAYSPYMGISQIAPANFVFQVRFDAP